MMNPTTKFFLSFLLPIAVVFAEDIPTINGPGFQSPLANKAVTGVTGLVTASSATGFWLTSSPPVTSDASDSIYVYTKTQTVLDQVKPGDIISLDGKIQAYRSSVDYLFLTELTSPTNIKVESSGNPVEPVVLGAGGLHPPTQQYTSLDVGGPLAVPNNASQLATSDVKLDVTKFGLDFWQSLQGKLVKVTNPTVVSYPNTHGDFWIRGDWPVTGLNERGGLTITMGDDGVPDLNPETITIGSPIDGTKNPDVWMGTTISEVTGIMSYAFGTYRVLPLTAPTVVAHNETLQGPTTLTVPTENPSCSLVFGDYNVENMTWNSTHLPKAASQIGEFLKTPDLVFLQEIQDDTGPTKDGVVTSNKTLQTFVDAIKESSGVAYDFAYISPLDGQDGGEPGGNIRPAFLYRSDRLKLVNPNAGSATDATEVTGSGSALGLKFNPGRIDPTNAAWEATRKPLVALFEMVESHEQIFAIDVHMSSKGGSSSLHGSPRPPVNGVVDKRIAQVGVLADFVESILTLNANASIIASGDFNDFLETTAIFDQLTSKLMDIDEAAGVPPTERYTYVFDMNSQQLDHAFISPKLQSGAEVEHLHTNNWVKLSDRTSDHDPSVSRVKLC